MAPNLSMMQHNVCFYAGNHCCSEFMSPTAMLCQEDIILLQVFLVSGSSFLPALFSSTPLGLEVLDKLSHLDLNTLSSLISNMVSGSFVSTNPLQQCSISLGGVRQDVPFRSAHPTITYFQHFYSDEGLV